jgi:hypothetical protein
VSSGCPFSQATEVARSEEGREEQRTVTSLLFLSFSSKQTVNGEILNNEGFGLMGTKQRKNN